MLKEFICVIILGVFANHIYKYRQLMDYGRHDVIYKHYPGPCIQLEGADGGSEDLATLPDGLTFISSGLYPNTKPRILLFDFKDSRHKLKELKMEGIKKTFRPHGISVWDDPKSNVVTLMIVAHGDTESVEIFEFTRGTVVLKHLKSVQMEIQLNDIVAVGKDKFYGTQPAENPYGNFMTYIEIFGMLRWGKVWFYDGNKAKPVLSGLFIPNGINVSPDLKYLYVAEFNGKSIMTYKIQGDGDLKIKQKIFIDTLPDNLEVDRETGDLWIGCHPRGHQILHYHFNAHGKSISPSQVLKIKTKNGEMISDITEVFLDDGRFCSASSTASHYKGRMLLGTVGSELLLCDVL